MNVIGYSCWYSVLSRNPVNNVMSVLLLFPITGLLTSIFILGETPNTYAYFGGAIGIPIISGVAMILINKRSKNIKKLNLVMSLILLKTLQCGFRGTKLFSNIICRRCFGRRRVNSSCFHTSKSSPRY